MTDENCLQIFWHVEQWWVCMRTQEWCTFHGMPHHPSADMLPRYRTTRCSKSAWQVVSGSMPPSLTTISSNDKRAVVNLAIVDKYLVETTTISSFSHLFTSSKCIATEFSPPRESTSTCSSCRRSHSDKIMELAKSSGSTASRNITFHDAGGWHQRLVHQSQTQSSFVAKIFGPILSDQLMSWN